MVTVVVKVMMVRSPSAAWGSESPAERGVSHDRRGEATRHRGGRTGEEKKVAAIFFSHNLSSSFYLRY